MIVRPMVQGDSPVSRPTNPGDLFGLGESISAGLLTTAGAGTLTGALIATGLIRRTGPGGGYTDTTDSATAILAALAGNAPAADVMPGTTFRLLFINTVAQAMVLAAGAGVFLGTGTTTTAASLWREYLVTIQNATPQQIISCATTNASAVVTFNLATGQAALPMGTITPGMDVSGTGITAGTTVLGVTQGQGGITGVTLSANATATTNPVALTFGPRILIDGLRSGTI